MFRYRLNKLTDLCVPTPCKNNGTCTTHSNSGNFTCHCPDEWTGNTCNIGIRILYSEIYNVAEYM